ncbi:hypothetical protein GGS21DRAFT_1338 [Xylaria nigripes]|nr:hypothetical protein GGS21DRAFT_1338 [Xylaria nigripes]
MPVITLRHTRQAGQSFYSLISRSEASAITLSTGAIAGITVAGSVLVFLAIVGPLLVRLAKRKEELREDGSGSSFAEHGYLTEDGGYRPPRRLRKSAPSEDATNLEAKERWSEETGKRLSKHLSLPVIPPVFFLRPKSFSAEDDFSAYSSREGVRGRSENEDTSGNDRRMHSSPEKHRGFIIHQNRRKTSWIDEDALHGPRISPKRSMRKKMSWLTGSGLTRSLSRRFSINRQDAPELAHSPTLPCTEGDQQVNCMNTSMDGLLESAENSSEKQSDPAAQDDTVPCSSNWQPMKRGGSLANDRNRILKPWPKQSTVPGTVRRSAHYHSDTVINAAQQLAGSARVPSFDFAANGRRYSVPQPRSTDTELQAILRRTAERLQDGSPSTRRQTLMLPTSTPSKIPGQLRLVTGRGRANGKEQVKPENMSPSPARSQRSAPAVMLCSELDGDSRKPAQGRSQNAPPWQTHRRTHTQRISYFSQASRGSVVSEPNSLTASPTRRNSQADGLQTGLSTPIRMVPTSPPRAEPYLEPCSYSPVSVQSSALSTVYSEEEGSSPISTLNLDNAPQGGREMEGAVTAQAPGGCQAPDRRFGNRDSVGKKIEGKKEFSRKHQTGHEFRSFHQRTGTLSQTSSNGTPAATVPVSTGQTGISPHGFTISPKASTVDPFTNHTAPTGIAAQRLSQVPSSADKGPTDTLSPSIRVIEPLSPTPIRPPPRGRIIPPPFCLHPNTSLSNPGGDDNPPPQTQTPPREPSPVVSEGGLSSVYESYRYSRQEDDYEGLHMSPISEHTVPQHDTKTVGWDKNIISRSPVANRRSLKMAHIKAHSRTNNGVSWAGAGRHSVVPSPSTTGNESATSRYTMGGQLSRSKPCREVSSSTVSDVSGASVYSQDEDGTDRLAPLMSLPLAAALAGRRAMRVTSAVKQLRRMDSQTSCTSGYSTATTNTGGGAESTSPTLPALRGGGCSPGKSGVGAGTKNYLALGSASVVRDGKSEHCHEVSKFHTLDDGRYGDKQYEEEMARIGIRKDIGNESTSKGMPSQVTLQRNSGGRARRNTAVEGFEQDLNRARQILRESRGHNIQTMQETPKKRPGVNNLMTPVTKSRQEEGRASLESLGIYDEKGFLKSPSPKKD